MGSAFFLCIAACTVILGADADGQPDAYLQALSKSVEHEKSRAYGEAIAVLLKQGKGHDREYLFNARLGWLHYLNGKYDDAERYYRAAIKTSPKSVEAKLGCLLPMLAAARYREAEILARGIVKDDPRSYYGNLRLVVALRLQQKNDEAAEIVKTMLITYPADGYFIGELSLLNASRGSSSTGNAEADKALRASHKLEQDRQYAEAIQAVQGQYAANPTDYALNLRLGWLNYLYGDYARSADHYYAAIQASPRATEAGVGYLLPLLAQARYKDAETFARQILKSDPGNYYGKLRLAVALRLQGEYAAAGKIVQSMLDAYPADVYVMSETALLAVAEGKKETAKQVFSSILALDPENETAKRELSKL